MTFSVKYIYVKRIPSFTNKWSIETNVYRPGILGAHETIRLINSRLKKIIYLTRVIR